MCEGGTRSASQRQAEVHRVRTVRFGTWADSPGSRGGSGNLRTCAEECTTTTVGTADRGRAARADAALATGARTSDAQDPPQSVTTGPSTTVHTVLSAPPSLSTPTRRNTLGWPSWRTKAHCADPEAHSALFGLWTTSYRGDSDPPGPVAARLGAPFQPSANRGPLTHASMTGPSRGRGQWHPSPLHPVALRADSGLPRPVPLPAREQGAHHVHPAPPVRPSVGASARSSWSSC